MLGQEHRHDKVLEICFVIEAWTAKYNHGEERHCRPSEDPERREVVTVQVLSAVGKSLKQSMYIAEIIRAGDSSEKDSDLLMACFSSFVGERHPYWMDYHKDETLAYHPLHSPRRRIECYLSTIGSNLSAVAFLPRHRTLPGTAETL